MDEAGIEKTILSLSSPTIQSILDTDQAIDSAKRVNEYIAGQIRDHRDRFESFAALPTQSPDAAADELHRCVEEYGFKGALINGFCQIGDPDVPVYLDVSLKRFETVFPAVGSAASAIELTCDELERCCGKNFVQWVDVCKGWQPEEA